MGRARMAWRRMILILGEQITNIEGWPTEGPSAGGREIVQASRCVNTMGGRDEGSGEQWSEQAAKLST